MKPDAKGTTHSNREGVHVLIKRLAIEDINEVENAQKWVPALETRIRSHKKWLAKTLSDFRNSRQFAIAAYIQNSAQRYDIVGCAIFKPSSSGLAKVRNIVVKPELSPELKTAVYTNLLDFIGRYAPKRSYTQIDIELFVPFSGEPKPKEGFNPVAILVESGFLLQSVRMSPFYREDSFYWFTKFFKAGFHGDARDHPELARWLLEAHFGFSDVGRFQHIHSRDETLFVCTFTIPSPQPPYELKGVAIIDPSSSKENERTAEGILAKAPVHGLFDQLKDEPTVADWLGPKANLRVLIQFYQEAALSVSLERTWHFSPNDLKKVLGGQSRRHLPPHKIGGVLLEVTPEELDESLAARKPFTYFLVTTGFDLHSAWLESTKNTPLYGLLADDRFDESNDRSATVWGVAQISLVLKRTVQAAYNSTGPSVRIWRREDYELFVGVHGPQEQTERFVYVLELSPPVKFKRRVKLSDIFASIENDLSTRYVSKSEISDLSSVHGATLTRAKTIKSQRGQEVGTDWSSSLIGIFHTAFTELRLIHNPIFVRPFDSEHDKILRGAAKRKPANARNDEVLFPNLDTDDNRAVKLAGKALEHFHRSSKDQALACWKLRLSLNKYISPVRDENIRELLKEYFFNDAALLNAVLRHIRVLLISIFRSNREANSVHAHRSMVLKDLFGIDSNRYSHIIQLETAEFAFELVQHKSAAELLAQILNPLRKAVISPLGPDLAFVGDEAPVIDELHAAVRALVH